MRFRTAAWRRRTLTLEMWPTPPGWIELRERVHFLRLEGSQMVLAMG